MISRKKQLHSSEPTFVGTCQYLKWDKHDDHQQASKTIDIIMIGEKGREPIAGNMKENVAHEPAPSLRRGDASIEGDRWKQAQNHESILDVCTFRAKQNAGHQSREESPLNLQFCLHRGLQHLLAASVLRWCSQWVPTRPTGKRDYHRDKTCW